MQSVSVFFSSSLAALYFLPFSSVHSLFLPILSPPHRSLQLTCPFLTPKVSNFPSHLGICARVNLYFNTGRFLCAPPSHSSVLVCVPLDSATRHFAFLSLAESCSSRKIKKMAEILKVSPVRIHFSKHTDLSCGNLFFQKNPHPRPPRKPAR